MDLEQQARQAGGGVHALIGNHEAMNLYGELKYVTKEDFAGFQGPKAQQLQDSQLRSALEDLKREGAPPKDENAWRKKFLDEHPLGWVEHRMAFQARRQIRKVAAGKQNAIIKIDDALFLHGGISKKYATISRREINNKVRAELADFTKLEGGMVTASDGPLWYRGLAELPETDPEVAALLPRALATHQARHIVIGHTPQVAVLPRFDGKVIVIDVGLSKPFDGPPAFLLIEDGKYFAVHRGQRLDLPVEGKKRAWSIFGAAAAMEPVNSRLRRAVPEPAADSRRRS